MFNKKSAARAERRQHRIDAGLVSTLYPEVASIAISMIYSQRGIKQAMPRTVNFFPSSYAYFTVECLSKDCVEGGFNFTHILTGMIGNHKKSSKGELGCEGGPSADHSAIVYEVAIQYV